MKRFLIAAAMVASICLPGAASADAKLKDLFQREQATLASLPDRHLKSMLSEGQPRARVRPEAMSYTQSWLDSQPDADGDAQWRCLAEALYFEARGETVKGQFAVAEVIMNRVKSGLYPQTPCAVVKQGTGRLYQCQFTYTCDGRKDVIAEPAAFRQVAKVARAVIDGLSGGITGGATHYHTVAVRPSWARVYTQTAKIGVHVFYRNAYVTASSE